MIPPDIQYCLDSMIELDIISGDIYEYYFEFKENLINWFDTSNGGFEKYLDDYNGWRQKAPAIERAYCSKHGWEYIKQNSNNTVLAMSWDIVEKYKKLPSVVTIKKHIWEGQTQQKYMSNFHNILNNSIVDFVGITKNDLNEYSEELREKRRLEYEELNEAFRNQQFDFIESYEDRITVKKHTEIKKTKTMIKKSVSLMEQFFGKENTSIFISGNHVEVTGKKFAYHLSKNYGLNVLGHSGLTIAIHDKKTGEYLSKLCFYYDKMPVADQAVAFMLDIQSGNEDEILNIGNCYALSEEGRSHKILKNYFPSQSVGEFNNRFLDFGLPPTPDYFNELKDICKNILINRLHNSMKPILKFDDQLALTFTS